MMDTDQVVEHAAAEGRDPRWRRRVNLIMAAVIVSIAVLGALFVWQYATARQLAQDQADAAHVAQQLAGQVMALGGKPVATPPTPVTGPAGITGQTGAAGRGITATAIVDGNLVITYTDGSTANVGSVMGPAGKEGRSVTATAIANGNLDVAYSDGTTTDVGPVVGPQGTAGANGSAGRGVQSVAIDTTSGHLMVTYSDGTTVDAGQAVGPAGQTGPAGPQGATGPAGADGQPPYSWTYTDGIGLHYYCARTATFDAANPTYTCSTTTAAAAAGKH